MMNHRRHSQLIPLALILLLVAGGVSGASIDYSKAIDNYIEDLKYDPNVVLAYEGERVSGAPRIGTLDDTNTFVVTERVKESLTTAQADIGVIASNEHQSYPGNLLLANRRLVDNSPDVLAVERDPLTYTVNLPGMTTDGSFTIVPSFSAYQSAVNKALNTWFEKYPNDHDVIANFQTAHSMAYSKELLRVKFGVDFKNSDVEANIDFSAVNNQEKLIMVHMFKQIFYTVSVEATKTPSDLFGPSVTLNEVKDKTDNKNPPVLVDSVSYGRTIYVKLETTSTDHEAKFVLENKITAFDISNDNEIEFKKNLKDLSITVYVVGGSSGNIALINADKLQEVNDIIVKYGKFSRNNLGFPVSYSTQFIKDNSRALISCSTEYIKTTSHVNHSGIVRIVHHGLFIMKWEVTWKEVTYDKNGNKIETANSWERNGKHLTAPFKEEIELPGNTVAIHVFAKELTALPWQKYWNVIDRSGIPLIEEREFKVWGTTLHPKYHIKPDL